MGHTRLGQLPRTRNWIQVLDLIGGGATIPQIAAETMRASQAGLRKGAHDAGLNETVWLLMRVPLAARTEHFIDELRRLGLRVSNSPGLLEIVAAFTGAIDVRFQETGGRTDLGEMAQMAAAEAITSLITQQGSLFGTGPLEVQRAFRGFSAANQFGVLAREFFARLTRKHLTYFLSRELSNYVSGKGRFTSAEDHEAFNRALDLHCRQASRIVEDFSGEWLSKTEFESGITPETVQAFVYVALKKLRAEFAVGSGLHAE
jgi:hypothetical protein